MVIAIHTNLFHDADETLNFFVVQIVCRLAVPFFAVCSGYFLTRKILAESGENHWRIFIKQWKKLLLIYGIWALLYLPYSIPMWIRIGWFSPFAFVDYFVGAFTKGAHYHLWYLWGMIYTLPVFYLTIKKLPRGCWAVFATFLWVIKASTYDYSHLFPQIPKIIELSQKCGTFLCLLPLLLIGALIATQSLHSQKVLIFGIVICSIGLWSEAFSLHTDGHDAVSYIFFTLPLIYFLFQSILKIKLVSKSPVCRFLGPISMFIYCIHPMILESTADIFSSSIIHFLFVSIISTALPFTYYSFKNCIRKKCDVCSN